MPRTRSLAWSELKIGIITVAALALAVMLIVAVGGQGGFSWDRYTLQHEIRQRPGAQVRRGRARRRCRSGQGHRCPARRGRSAGDARHQRRTSAADHRSITRRDRVAEPPGRADHRGHPGVAGASAAGRRIHPERSERGRHRGTGRTDQGRGRTVDGAPHRRPRRQGHGRQAVHRRAGVHGIQRAAGVRRTRGRAASTAARVRSAAWRATRALIAS